jgi:hypothetical protein
MEIGYFTMPSHPPECGLKEGHDWDLQVIRWLDEPDLRIRGCWSFGAASPSYSPEGV